MLPFADEKPDPEKACLDSASPADIARYNRSVAHNVKDFVSGLDGGKLWEKQLTSRSQPVVLFKRVVPKGVTTSLV